MARRYREETGLTVSLAGRIVSPEVAAELVETGATDLVTVARALHADPDWARHAITGSAPRPCIYGNQGCADVIFTGRPLWCTVNPGTGREGERVPPSAPGHQTGHVLVVGAGPAGLQAALVLAEAGLRVVVRERNTVPGGQLAMASQLRAKPQFGRLLRWYADRLAEHGVTVELDAEVSASSLSRDVVGLVDATGGTDYVPAVPGAGAGRVVGVRSWLRTGLSETGGVTIWGADRCGAYVADHLAAQGRSVTLVGRQTEIAPDAGQRERLPAVERLLASPHVNLVLGATVEEVLAESVVISIDGDRSTLPVTGPVVASLGSVPAGLDPSTPLDPLRVVAGEAGGATTLDEAIASGDRAAQHLVARLRSADPVAPS
jgi:NADPH-dependent 2,4-dienoyl-CoA reductase/sulfur reductase-like enzyme